MQISAQFYHNSNNNSRYPVQGAIGVKCFQNGLVGLIDIVIGRDFNLLCVEVLFTTFPRLALASSSREFSNGIGAQQIICIAFWVESERDI